MILGSHVSMDSTEQFLGAVKEALSYEGKCFYDIYRSTTKYKREEPTDEMFIEEGRLLMEENNIPFENVVVHAPYIINLANETNHDFGVKFLTERNSKNCGNWEGLNKLYCIQVRI